jgi:hypothetical protein
MPERDGLDGVSRPPDATIAVDGLGPSCLQLVTAVGPGVAWLFVHSCKMLEYYVQLVVEAVNTPRLVVPGSRQKQLKSA